MTPTNPIARLSHVTGNVQPLDGIGHVTKQLSNGNVSRERLGERPMRGLEWGHVTRSVYPLDYMSHVVEQLSNGDVSRDRDNELLLV